MLLTGSTPALSRRRAATSRAHEMPIESTGKSIQNDIDTLNNLGLVEFKAGQTIRKFGRSSTAFPESTRAAAALD